MDVDLSKCRTVERADAVAYRKHLAFHGGMQVFTILWVVPRAFPLPDILEQSALIDMPFVHGSGADRVERVAEL